VPQALQDQGGSRPIQAANQEGEKSCHSGRTDVHGPLCHRKHRSGVRQPASGKTDTAETGNLGEALTVLHAVGQWSIDVSKMADERAKSDLVKNYARAVATANADLDAKLMEIAKKNGIEVAALDPKTEQGKSLLDRIKAETLLLSSLKGDAFDKEYMTLVTNTQQSVSHFLEAHKAAAKDPAVKRFMGDMNSMVQKRLKTAQDILAKVYGNSI
jgi:predicted outer membrane protein